MIKYVLIITFFLLSCDLAWSGEDSSFAAFYKEDIGIDWVWLILGALIAAVVVYVTVGAAAPYVAGIGTWIGGLMGYSGAVATNAGLALMGGGALAAGGFGMAGGAAVLTMALTFSTDLVIDFTADILINEYDYQELAEKSSDLLTLPLPVNNSGPDNYKAAVEIVEDYATDPGVTRAVRDAAISRALRKLNFIRPVMDDDERAKVYSLMALLQFISNDYISSEISAKMAMDYARSENADWSLPAFIFAVSNVYNPEFEFNSVTRKYFRHAILSEPDNPFIPLMFSIYMDRLELRYSETGMNSLFYISLLDIMKDTKLEQHRSVNYSIMASRYLVQMKFSQQKIMAITSSLNRTIKTSELALNAVKYEFDSYAWYIEDMVGLMQLYNKIELDEKGSRQRDKFQESLDDYVSGMENLKKLVDELDAYQRLQKAIQEKSTNEMVVEEEGYLEKVFILYFVLFFLVVLGRKYIR